MSIECSGRMRITECARKRIAQGARRVMRHNLSIPNSQCYCRPNDLIVAVWKKCSFVFPYYETLTKISAEIIYKSIAIFFKEENYSSYTLFIKKIKKYIMYKNKIFCIENKKKKLKSCSWKNLIKSKIKMWRSWEIVWSH